MKVFAKYLWIVFLMVSPILVVKSQPLLRLLKPEQTGIHFSNFIKDTIGANILLYEAFYDGGGVAIGDLNGDGLQDIYFAGNQTGDQLYLNEGKLIFKDITQEAGIVDKGGWSTGVSMADVNGDGWLDIYVCKSLYDEEPLLRVNELYINNGNLTFTEAAAEWGLNDPWRSMHASFFDFDRDGDQDLFLVNQPPNPGMFSPLHGQNWLDTLFSCRLLENTGTRFVDITTQAGVRNRGYGLSASMADFNRDGWTDIYVCNDYDSPDFLYINQRDGTFKNVINESMQHISYFSMGSDAADINHDGWMDLITLDMVAEDNYRLKANMGGMEPAAFWNIVHAGGHRQYMFNALQLNRGVNADGRLLFSDIAQLAGVASTDWSWAPLWMDLDNDGHKDLFITNGIKKDLRNTDAIHQTEIYLKETTDQYVKENPGRGNVNIWDVIDLQHVLDLIPSQKLVNYLYRNTGDYGFEKVMESWGADQATFSSGAAYGDLDNDGDLDLVVNNVDDVAFVYENRAQQLTRNHFLRIKLIKGGKEVSAFGSRVEIEYDGQKQYAEFSNARGFYSTSEPMVHFGLGKSKKLDRVKVIWTDGRISEKRNQAADQLLSFDWDEARITNKNPLPQALFKDVTDQSGITFVHKENPFDDYAREVLLPHQMSTLGPGLAVGDVNGDELEDFFVGGAAGFAGQLYLQTPEGKFTLSRQQIWLQDKYHEDMGADFLDIDMDGDLDLYVVSGGNEYEAGSALYQDRMYINLGKGVFVKAEGLLPEIRSSGAHITSVDYDLDGDLDLFIGGRQRPAAWPNPANSHLLINQYKESGKAGFIDATAELAPQFTQLGMVTDAVWTDVDQDDDPDLIVTGIWMPVSLFINENGKLLKREKKEFAATHGWWFSITAGDIDQDGDEDYLLGNLGLNYKYKASRQEPFSVHYDDFDGNGSHDIVLSYYNFGKQFPLRGRSCSSQQIPELKKAFPSYHEFASSTLSEIYSGSALQQALHYEAYQFESVWIENQGKQGFVMHPLPAEAQFSNINDAYLDDLNGDGKSDLIIAGNLFGSEVETTRNDASVGLLLQGDGNFGWEAVSMPQSGLCLPDDVKLIRRIHLGKSPHLLVASNQGPLRLIRLKE